MFLHSSEMYSYSAVCETYSLEGHPTDLDYKKFRHAVCAFVLLWEHSCSNLQGHVLKISRYQMSCSYINDYIVLHSSKW